jgi:hypothetical protein
MAELRVLGTAETATFTESAALKGDGRTTSCDPGSGHSNDAGRAQLRLTSRGTRDGGRRAPQRRRPGTVQRTIAPPLFQLVVNPFPLSMAPGAKAPVSVKALNLGTSGAVTAVLKLTWQPGHGTLDVKLTVSWS